MMLIHGPRLAASSAAISSSKEATTAAELGSSSAPAATGSFQKLVAAKKRNGVVASVVSAPARLSEPEPEEEPLDSPGGFEPSSEPDAPSLPVRPGLSSSEPGPGAPSTSDPNPPSKGLLGSDDDEPPSEPDAPSVPEPTSAPSVPPADGGAWTSATEGSGAAGRPGCKGLGAGEEGLALDVLLAGFEHLDESVERSRRRSARWCLRRAANGHDADREDTLRVGKCRPTACVPRSGR